MSRQMKNTQAHHKLTLVWGTVTALITPSSFTLSSYKEEVKQICTNIL